MHTNGDADAERESMLAGVASPLGRLLVADSPSPDSRTFFPASKSQSWRTPKRQKVLIVALAALLLSLLLFGKELFGLATPAADASFPQTLDLHEIQQPVTATHTVTYHAPAATETVTVSNTQSEELEPVVFVLLAWSAGSATEAAFLIKTVLMYITGPVEFHIVCDDDGKRVLESRLKLLTRPKMPVKVRWYQPSWDDMAKRVEREGSINTDHAAGTPGLMKLFFHEILPTTVKKAIYVDTDAIFISDPRYLWNVFKTLKDETAIVMSYHADAGADSWYNASKICSCVMLLDLAKLRAIRLMDSSIYRQDRSGKFPDAASPPAFKALFGDPDPEDGRYHKVKLGDQGYWFAIVDYRNDLFEPLAFEYEVSSCLFNMFETKLAGELKDDAVEEDVEVWTQGHTVNTPWHGRLIRPKLLHFNCLDGVDVWPSHPTWTEPDNLLNQRWGPAVRYHAGYKWTWLNSGPVDPSVEKRPGVDMIDMDFEFLDLQFAKQHAAGSV